MSILDLAAFDATPLTRDPFDFTIVENFIRPAEFKPVIADFPRIPGPGSHPPAELSIKGRFRELMAEMEGPAFRAAVEKKFDIDLTGRPTMYTVRGFVSDRDGHIHTDSKTKIITVLLYLNEGWEEEGGRLRLLRSNEGLDESGGGGVAERRHAAGVPPVRQFLARPQDLQGPAPRHPAQLGDGRRRGRQRAAPPRLREPREEAEEHVPAHGELTARAGARSSPAARRGELSNRSGVHPNRNDARLRGPDPRPISRIDGHMRSARHPSASGDSASPAND